MRAGVEHGRIVAMTMTVAWLALGQQTLTLGKILLSWKMICDTNLVVV